MSPSVVLAQPSDFTPEGTVTGRMSSSLVNDIDKAGNALRFEKAGTVAAGNTVGARWYNDSNVPRTVREVEVNLGTAPTGAGLVVDVKKGGTTVFAQTADRPTVAATQYRGSALATKTGDPVIVRPGEYLTVEVVSVGSTVAGADVSVKVKLV